MAEAAPAELTAPRLVSRGDGWTVAWEGWTELRRHDAELSAKVAELEASETEPVPLVETDEPEIAELIGEMLPRRMLFVTDDTLLPTVRQLLDEARCASLNKPFSKQALLAGVAARLQA